MSLRRVGSGRGNTPSRLTGTTFPLSMVASAPVLYLRCDDTSGALTDSSGLARTAIPVTHASITYAQAPAKTAIGGSSVLLGGAGDWGVSTPSYLQSLTSLSVGCWVKFSSAISANQWSCAVDNNSQGLDPDRVWGMYAANGGHCSVRVYTGGASGALNTVTTTANIGDNAWHWVVATATGGTLSIYVDGAFDTSIAYSGAINTGIGSSFLSVGAGSLNTGPGYQPWTGGLDEIAVWDRALSAVEIAQLWLTAA